MGCPQPDAVEETKYDSSVVSWLNEDGICFLVVDCKELTIHPIVNHTFSKWCEDGQTQSIFH
jgi:hypothetical protein